MIKSCSASSSNVFGMKPTCDFGQAKAAALALAAGVAVVAHLAVEDVEDVEAVAVAVAVVVAEAAVAAAAVAAVAVVAAEAAAWGVQAAAAAWDAAAWVVVAAVVGLEVLAVPAIQAVGVVLDAAVVVKGGGAVEVVDVEDAAVVATGEEKVVASNGDSLDGESHEFWVRCFIASVARHVRPKRASASPAWHI